MHLIIEASSDVDIDYVVDQLDLDDIHATEGDAEIRSVKVIASDIDTYDEEKPLDLGQLGRVSYPDDNDPLKFFPLLSIEQVPEADLARLGLTVEESWGVQPNGVQERPVMASATGEFRFPKRGEWLVGADMQARLARSDYTDVEYHIARIYKVRRREVIEIVKPGETI